MKPTLITTRHGASTSPFPYEPIGWTQKAVNMTQETTNPANSGSPLINLYSRASSKWQSTVERLGYPAAYDELIARSLSASQYSSPVNVLDVGTGTGTFTTALLQSSVAIDRVDLLEPSPDMLSMAEHRIGPNANRLRCFSGGIGSTQIDAGTYDIILCAHVIEHIEDVQAGLAWMKSRLKAQGVLLLAVSKPHWCTSLVRLQWGHAAYSPLSVEHLLGAAGFSQIDSAPFSKGPPSRTSYGYTARA